MRKATKPDYSDSNAIKADFNNIYLRKDPRSYYSVLGGMDYVIPDVARPIFMQLAEKCAAELGRGPITILDVGCSYGVNAAQIRHGLSIKQLRERYLAPNIERLSSEKVVEFDQKYFASWPAREDFRFIGLDISPEAIGYGRKTGLLDDGVAIDLQSLPLDTRTRNMVSQADLIISTGCVGYVTKETFTKLLAAGQKSPWIASFVLRMFDYANIEGALSEHGLVTEKFSGATFVQRRFRDRAECEQTLAALSARGIDPGGKETEGLLHAELFVSRPEVSVSAAPLTEIMSLTSGIDRAFGDRLRHQVKGMGDIAA